jgi:hypothetical protein
MERPILSNHRRKTIQNTGKVQSGGNTFATSIWEETKTEIRSIHKEDDRDLP